jgi:hypothetical protein
MYLSHRLTSTCQLCQQYACFVTSPFACSSNMRLAACTPMAFPDMAFPDMACTDALPASHAKRSRPGTYRSFCC